jgi:hypothetical protein
MKRQFQVSLYQYTIAVPGLTYAAKKRVKRWENIQITVDFCGFHPLPQNNYLMD